MFELWRLSFLTQIAENMTPGKAFGVEFLATFQLVLCVLAATDSRRNDVKGSAPLAIGLSVALGHLVAVSKSQPCVFLLTVLLLDMFLFFISSDQLHRLRHQSCSILRTCCHHEVLQETLGESRLFFFFFFD